MTEHKGGDETVSALDQCSEPLIAPHGSVWGNQSKRIGPKMCMHWRHPTDQCGCLFTSGWGKGESVRARGEEMLLGISENLVSALAHLHLLPHAPPTNRISTFFFFL